MNKLELEKELEEMVKIPGVSGYEGRIREYIRSKVIEIVDEKNVIIDAIGNLIVKVGSGERRIALIAHMDEIGLVVTKIEQDGKIAFSKIGGIQDILLPGTLWEIITEKGEINGVIGITPPHLAIEEAQKIIPWHQLRIDVGANSKIEVEKMGVKVLDPIAPKKNFIKLANNLVSARSLDDRFGCIALIKTLENIINENMEFKDEIYFIWSVQEEVGLKGAKVVANQINPQITIAVDSFPCCSTLTGDVQIGNGPVIRAIDRSSISNMDLIRYTIGKAQENKIPIQIGVTGGGNDGSVCQERGSKLIAIGVPMKYSHSLVETISLNDLENLIKLLILEMGSIHEYNMV
ncbi:MAG: M42 family metallopeptidase [Candidatus Methanomethylicia archaeon]